MPGNRLTPAQEQLARVLADAIVEDLLSAEVWLKVSCRDLGDQQALIARLRAEGREARAA